MSDSDDKEKLMKNYCSSEPPKIELSDFSSSDQICDNNYSFINSISTGTKSSTSEANRSSHLLTIPKQSYNRYCSEARPPL